DRERTVDVRDRVIAVHGAAGRDRVTADVAGGRRRGGERRLGRQTGGGVAVDQAGEAGRQRGQRGAVGLGLVVGIDHEADSGDRERAADVRDRVIAIHGGAG